MCRLHHRTEAVVWDYKKPPPTLPEVLPLSLSTGYIYKQVWVYQKLIKLYLKFIIKHLKYHKLILWIYRWCTIPHDNLLFKALMISRQIWNFVCSVLYPQCGVGSVTELILFTQNNNYMYEKARACIRLEAVSTSLQSGNTAHRKLINQQSV